MFSTVQIPEIVRGELGKALTDCGFNDQMKLKMYPMGANQLNIQIENIEDVFDTDGQVKTQQVNVSKLAARLFEIANTENHV